MYIDNHFNLNYNKYYCESLFTFVNAQSKNNDQVFHKFITKNRGLPFNLPETKSILGQSFGILLSK
jgi:hypothetical protein